MYLIFIWKLKIKTHEAYGVYFQNEDVGWKPELHTDVEGSTDQT
jgi:hypothetical protein